GHSNHSNLAHGRSPNRGRRPSYAQLIQSSQLPASSTRECAIAVPAVELAEKVVQVGNSSGRDIDKFEAFGLTPVPAERVTPPLVAECFANLECKVVDTRLVNKYCLFVLE